MKRQADIILMVSDAQGMYAPQSFGRQMKHECVLNVTPADWDALEEGPDAEGYWDLWDEIMRDAVVLNPETNVRYRIYQEGDIWLVEVGAEFDENSDFDLGYYIDDGVEEEQTV